MFFFHTFPWKSHHRVVYSQDKVSVINTWNMIQHLSSTEMAKRIFFYSESNGIKIYVKEQENRAVTSILNLIYLKLGLLDVYWLICEFEWISHCSGTVMDSTDHQLTQVTTKPDFLCGQLPPFVVQTSNRRFYALNYVASFLSNTSYGIMNNLVLWPIFHFSWFIVFWNYRSGRFNFESKCNSYLY